MKIKLTYPISAKEIEAVTGCTIHSAEDAEIQYITTHSSEVERDTLFIAMQGERTHGEAFRDIVIARGGYLLTEKAGERSFTVSSVSDALFALARAHLKRLTALRHTIAVTGSVGKTTTKEMLRILLSDRYRTHATEGNQNSEIGLPLTILCAPPDTELLILEMGMNHKGEIARLSLLSEPDLIIITNVGHAHIGNLGSRKAIAEAKKEILCGAKPGATVLIPSEEALLSDIADAKRIGVFSENGDYTLLPENSFSRGYALLKNGVRQARICNEIRDKGLLAAIAFAGAAALELGVQLPDLTDNNFNFGINIFRQKLYKGDKTEIVFDAYNASYESVICAIDTLKISPRKNRALLLGDMRELGAYASDLHKEVGRACAAARDEIHLLFLFGASAPWVASQAIADGFDEGRIFVNTEADRPEITAEAILRHIQLDTCLWIKGARDMKMERILKILLNDAGDNFDVG